VSDDKIIPFPTGAIVNLDKTGHTDKRNLPVEEQKTLKRIQDENTKKFCEGAIDDISMNLLRSFVELAIKTQDINFTKDLALIIDMLRGLIYRDFGLKHPSQQLVDTMVSITTHKNGQQSAKIDYSKVLNIKSKSNPLSKDVREELKDIQDGSADFFTPDGDLDD